MSVEAISWALSFEAENVSEKAVMLVLANYADGDGKCYPGQQNIAKQASCSERTVRRVLDSLEERAVISREERRRKDGSRTSDIIVLAAFQQPAKMAARQVTNRPTCPNQPATVSGLTTFEPSEDTSAAAARVKSDLDGLTAKLIEAAGEKIQPHGSIVLSPILGLIEAGCDLETDILPTIRTVASRLRRPAGSWAYFVGAIREAYEARTEAGKGLSKPKLAAKRAEDMTEDERRARWAKHLNMARSSGIWITWLNGPPPGQPGSRVPDDMIGARDLKIDWFEEKSQERAA